MARIFSIEFIYEGLQHHAMVAVRATPFFTEYAVTMLDDVVAERLPNNKIISTSKDHFAFSDSTLENAPALMHSILQAVSGHVHILDARLF